MTKTTTFKVAFAFALAVLLGASFFTMSQSIEHKSVSSANASLVDLLANPTFNTNACCGN